MAKVIIILQKIPLHIVIKYYTTPTAPPCAARAEDKILHLLLDSAFRAIICLSQVFRLVGVGYFKLFCTFAR